jgi:hypothetical protein
MSVSSVGASFGYINPASIGTQQAPPSQTDTDTTVDSTAAKTPSSDTSSDKASSNPQPQPPPQPQATSSAVPKFAASTGSALVKAQEQASAA